MSATEAFFRTNSADCLRLAPAIPDDERFWRRKRRPREAILHFPTHHSRSHAKDPHVAAKSHWCRRQSRRSESVRRGRASIHSDTLRPPARIQTQFVRSRLSREQG